MKEDDKVFGVGFYNRIKNEFEEVYTKDYVNELKQEIDRLNKIIDEIEKLFDNDITNEIKKYLPSKYINDFRAMYNACNLFLKDKLKDLKEEGK